MLESMKKEFKMNGKLYKKTPFSAPRNVGDGDFNCKLFIIFLVRIFKILTRIKSMNIIFFDCLNLLSIDIQHKICQLHQILGEILKKTCIVSWKQVNCVNKS